ncbi:MAG: hypothetical protein JST40_13670 [Armatimonadetes bacterium]|nr:hypothetical protein [Armatimonadota bacterium]
MWIPLVLAAAHLAPTLFNEDFESLDPWKAVESTGVSLTITADSGRTGKGMRLDYDYNNRGGYVLAQRTLGKTLPENFEISFWIKADSPRNNFEFKLMDPTGENVWWSNKVAYVWPKQWTRVSFRRRNLPFAWGPKPGAFTDIGDFQIGIAANEGGKGTVWVDDFEIHELPPIGKWTKTLQVDQYGKTADLTKVVEGKAEYDFGLGGPSATFDLGNVVEYGGLHLRWPQARPILKIESSSDGATWRLDGQYSATSKPLDQFIWLPDSQARYLRLSFVAFRGHAVLGKFDLIPIQSGDSATTFLEACAERQPSALVPATMRGEQVFWTVVGAPEGRFETLVNTDGCMELGKAAPMLQPIVNGMFPKGSSLNRSECTLEDKFLPLPIVRQRVGNVDFTTKVFHDPDSDHQVIVEYTLSNRGKRAEAVDFRVLMHPFQVNPPWQFLNSPGGFAPIYKLTATPDGATVNGVRRVAWTHPAEKSGARSWERGEVGFAPDDFPTTPSAEDSNGLASGSWRWSLNLKPGVPVTLSGTVSLTDLDVKPVGSPYEIGVKHQAAVAQWRKLTDGFDVTLPEEGAKLIELTKANLGYVLVNKDGPSIQPGSRSYERTWIRDGSMTSAALLRLGRFEAAKAMVEWYSHYIGEDGWVPCVVDRRGADPVPEHDSHGEYLYLLAETVRFTKDLELAKRYYPLAQKVVENIERLRATRKVGAYLTGTPIERACYGLMPESISHEGYSDKPRHSLWDDFFTLRGLKDAVYLAELLGHAEDGQRYRSMLTEMRGDVRTAIERAQKIHNISFVPGCIELGDGDTTSTSIAFYPVQEDHIVPSGSLEASFEQYWKFFEGRRSGKDKWDGYTPYEIRNVESFLMLGQRERAHQLLDWFRQHSYPKGWNHWAEIVFSNPEKGRWIGDMPHTWVGSELIRAVRNMIVLEKDVDSSLVIGAGIRESWLKPGATIEGKQLTTAYGKLDWKMTPNASGVVVDYALVGQVPPGGVVVAWAYDASREFSGPDGAEPTDIGVRLNLTKGRIIMKRSPVKVTGGSR